MQISTSFFSQGSGAQSAAFSVNSNGMSSSSLSIWNSGGNATSWTGFSGFNGFGIGAGASMFGNAGFGFGNTGFGGFDWGGFGFSLGSILGSLGSLFGMFSSKPVLNVFKGLPGSRNAGNTRIIPNNRGKDHYDTRFMDQDNVVVNDWFGKNTTIVGKNTLNARIHIGSDDKVKLEGSKKEWRLVAKKRGGAVYENADSGTRVKVISHKRSNVSGAVKFLG